jgi:hypothetical protein
MVAFYASRVGNLIEAVNILGSLFYGTILGIFLVAFYMKRISGTAVFYAALFAEAFYCIRLDNRFNGLLVVKRDWMLISNGICLLHSIDIK